MISGFKYKVSKKYTKEHGWGIFAEEPIPANSLVWTLVKRNHKTYNYDELLSFVNNSTDDEIKHVLNHIYCQGNVAILCEDEAEYVNHSSNPNLTQSPVDCNIGCWSARNIAVGEELLDDYSKYETPQWYLDLCKKYNVESSKDVCELYK